MYFQLNFDVLSDIGITADFSLPPEVSFISGAVITAPLPVPLPFVTDGKAGDKIPDFWGGGVPLMSAAFVKILQESGADNLQVFPATVMSEQDNTCWSHYFAVNIIGIIRCANLAKSDCTEVAPGVFVFDELAIDAEKAKGALLFRLDESPATIVIHKSLAKHLLTDDPEGLLTGWDVTEIIQ